jgi:hypothetical protein
VTSRKRKRDDTDSQPANQNKTWNPGGTHEERTKLIKIAVPSYVYSLIATVSDVNVAVETDEESRTELDSHANMAVVGRHAFIISDSGRIADVNPFTPDYESMQVPIVDVVVLCECPYNRITYVLVIQNALYVPAMKNNLLPPFMLREAGVKVHEKPKIYSDDPAVDDHSISFPETGFCIPMSLWGTFSYFPISKPMTKEMQETEEIYLLTPSRWNSHSDAYAMNEDNILDWEGNLKEKKDRNQDFCRRFLRILQWQHPYGSPASSQWRSARFSRRKTQNQIATQYLSAHWKTSTTIRKNASTLRTGTVSVGDWIHQRNERQIPGGQRR